ncbi:NUDIX domain-containing protein [Ammonicoccus fulvus]|uniref:NUDIX domain-containing protein n=1 Tax=Ammonicoccus fulvus TaxID=3138240 RepID=A0ABZ3FIJ9_9ACTN
MSFRSEHPVFAVTVDLVVLTLRERRLCVLLIERGVEPYAGQLALPGGFVRLDEDLEHAAYRELHEETGFGPELVRGIEQLRTYGAPGRDPRPERVVSVAWVILGADFPEPVAASDAAAASWVALDDLDVGDLAFDHAEILTDGVDRARAKLEYTSLATAFVAEEFTISELRGVYEAIWGESLDAANFQRKVTGTPNFLVPTDHRISTGRGRPAQLFRRGPTTELHPPMRRGIPT